MSNAFALSVGLRRGSYYQVWNLHKFSDESENISLPIPLPAKHHSIKYL